MFRVKLFEKRLNNYLTLCRNYLSHEFKDVMLKGEQTGKSASGAINIDYFVNNLAITEPRPIEVCDQFLKLRSKRDALEAFDSINYGVVRHFVDHENINDLLHILWNRLDYGVFLDDFTGSYLMNQLLEQQNFSVATQIAIQLMMQEDTSNKLISALSIKSCYEYVKKYESEPPPPEEEVDKKSEKKVRVKFLRNPIIKDMNKNSYTLYLIGKTLIQMSNICQKDIEHNMKALGHLLCNQHKEFTDVITSSESVLYKDVLNLCLSLVKDKANIPAELINSIIERLEKNALDLSFDDKLQEYVKETTTREEQQLIEKQKANYAKWLQIRENDLSSFLDINRNVAPDIDSIIKEIDEKKQKLWFFETEDKLDLEIYQKRVTYPKRWFGKKKTPKAIDDDYIPPEVTKKVVK